MDDLRLPIIYQAIEAGGIPLSEGKGKQIAWRADQ